MERLHHFEKPLPVTQEIKEIIQTLINNKAPREGGITVEVLKIQSDDLTRGIHALITELWKTEMNPKD